MRDFNEGKLEKATLGGGCFWCTEAVFLEIEGVTKVLSGYSGGTVKNPTYQQVTTGRTGHAEVIQVTFKPEVISFREVLEVFFTMHDPTSLNRQGADVGTQYRSVIFYHSEEQRRVAEDFIREMNETNVFNLQIVTQLEPFREFYEAEDYHKNYYARNKEQGYSRFVIAPKLEKVEEKFKEKIK
ncbi:peptide-methionine (S)-S-oxide reductase MsrA [Candidatus Bathyarchaeota archaeon]|nr:MAG: peptide-methionine (S)-S-oxide reductase MsrA [Candidatus Bathyarchaeota archaeon]